MVDLAHLTMSFGELGHQCNSPFRRNIRVVDESRMRDIAQKDELPKIGIDGHRSPVFGIRTFEQHPIARVGSKLASLENIEPLPA